MAISETRFVRFESCGSVTKSHTVLLCPAQEAHRPLVRCLRSRPAVGDQVTVTVSQCSCVSRPGYTQQWPKAICMASTTSVVVTVLFWYYCP